MADPCQNCHEHPVFDADPDVSLHLCTECYEDSVICVDGDGKKFSWYTPQPHQRPYHRSNCPNLLALGTRGTGKSKMMRADAIIRCLKFAGFKVLIIRRTIKDLRKSHLRFINAEMKQLGDDVGYYRESTHDVVFSNDSFIQFSHCETTQDIANYLSSEWDLIIFDELSTFTLEMFLLISAACRTTTDKPYMALVRAGSNWVGIGAAWMAAWFVDHNVDMVEYPDYNPDEFEVQFSTMDDNRYVKRGDYEKRLRNTPEHIRKAWLYGERVIEGAYFTEFLKKKEITDEHGRKRVVGWHVIPSRPTWSCGEDVRDILDIHWISVFRAVDWGYHPDPAVCLWIALLPNRRGIVFKERTWKRTLAKDVAQEIKRDSKGMHVIDTFADPTMFVKRGEAQYSIGEIFEQNGVPLTASENDRALYGYAIHELLNTEIDGYPSIQIVEHACPELVKTIPLLQMDVSDPRKIADGPDHWACCLAYYGMGQAQPTLDPLEDHNPVPRWMRPPQSYHPVVG